MPGIFREYLFRGHLSDGLCDSCPHHVDDAASPYYIHERDYHEPYEETAAADDEGIFQPDYVSESEDGGSRVELHDEFRLVGHDCTPVHYGSGNGLSPKPERGDYEII